MDQETPRLPSAKIHFNNSNNSRLERSTPQSRTKKRRNISKRELSLNKSSHSNIEEATHQSKQLKGKFHKSTIGFLESKISSKRRKIKPEQVDHHPVETMENIPMSKSGSSRGDSLRNSYRDDHPTFRQKAQTQNANYLIQGGKKSENTVLNPSTKAERRK